MKADDFLAANLAVAISTSNLGRVIPVLDTKKALRNARPLVAGARTPDLRIMNPAL